MREKKIKKMIQEHRNSGKIENANKKVRIGWHFFKLNVFTLKLSNIGKKKLNIQHKNAQLVKKIRKDQQLYKEVREFRLMFRFFKRLKIEKGEIRKSEMPDFVLTQNGKTCGIEVTRIYTGNDWIAEKLHQDIEMYRLKDKRLEQYIGQRKYIGKIRTYQTKKGIVVQAIKDKTYRDEEVAEVKNKLFEKIRKMMDDYTKHDFNYIFAEIVFTAYENEKFSEKLNQEIQFFISHLDVIFGESEFHLLLKIGNLYKDFDLKRGTYHVLS